MAIEIDYISYSRLEKYEECPRLYQYHYITKEQYHEPFNVHFFLGSKVHKLLEEYLIDKNLTPDSTFPIYVSEWISELGIRYTTEDLNVFTKVVYKLADLLHRCSIFCTDPEQIIRNKDGSILKNPGSSPSAALTKEIRNQNLAECYKTLDVTASQQNPELLEISVCWLFAEILHLARSFGIPEWVNETLHVELGISTNEHNLVQLPGLDVYFRGFIDWVVELQDGCIAIIDHKTSKAVPSNNEVLHHPQLNLYAYCYQQIYGRLPDVIGIHHLRSGEIIMSRVTEHIMLEFVHSFVTNYRHSCAGVYPKRKPTSFNTPCIKKDYKSNRVIYICPFMNKCWPTFAQLM